MIQLEYLVCLPPGLELSYCISPPDPLVVAGIPPTSIPLLGELLTDPIPINPPSSSSSSSPTASWSSLWLRDLDRCEASHGLLSSSRMDSTMTSIGDSSILDRANLRDSEAPVLRAATLRFVSHLRSDHFLITSMISLSHSPISLTRAVISAHFLRFTSEGTPALNLPMHTNTKVLEHFLFTTFWFYRENLNYQWFAELSDLI